MTDMPTCHGTFSPMMMLNATTAFKPMPEARASGRFAKTPMQMHMMAAPRHVAVASAGIHAAPTAPLPNAADRMPGLTKMMYAIVMKVTTPASISVRTLVPRSVNLKNFSIRPALLDVVPDLCERSPMRPTCCPLTSPLPPAGSAGALNDHTYVMLQAGPSTSVRSVREGRASASSHRLPR